MRAPKYPNPGDMPRGMWVNLWRDVQAIDSIARGWRGVDMPEDAQGNGQDRLDHLLSTMLVNLFGEYVGSKIYHHNYSTPSISNAAGHVLATLPFDPTPRPALPLWAFTEAA